MNKKDELEKRVRDSGTLINRLDECHKRIGKMCSERRPPKMTIPVQWDDDDFFISVTLKDAIDSQPSALVNEKRERYLHDSNFHNLVSYVHKGIYERIYTLQDLRDAVEIIACFPDEPL